MTSPTVRVAALITLVANADQLGDSLRRMVIDHLGRLDPQGELAVHDVDAGALQRIYQVRAGHIPEDVFGTMELLTALTAYDGERLAMVGDEDAGTDVSAWLDPELTRVIGCIIAPDRRVQS